MTASILIVAALLVFALRRMSNRSRVGPHQDLNWWHWSILLVAVIIALLIVVTPEFVALGFVGDTAFFDLLVLLTSLQLHWFGAQARSWFAGFVSKAMWWAMTPRLSYLLVLSTWAAIGDLVGSVAAAWHRLSS